MDGYPVGAALMITFDPSTHGVNLIGELCTALTEAIPVEQLPAFCGQCERCQLLGGLVVQKIKLDSSGEMGYWPASWMLPHPPPAEYWDEIRREQEALS